MTSPGPIPLQRLAKTLRMPEADVRESMDALCRHWGSHRVIAVTDGVTVRVTPAAVTAIHQAFGIRRLAVSRTSSEESRA